MQEFPKGVTPAGCYGKTQFNISICEVQLI